MLYLQKYIEKIIRGEKTGYLAAGLKWLLFLLSLFYSCLAKLRYYLYQHNILQRKKAEVPVISIGNLATGGTGKTPFVAFLAEELGKDYQIAIISRGYGAEKEVVEPFLISDQAGLYAAAAQAGDELFMLARNNSELIFIRSAERAAGAKLAVEKGADLILLDDGFQHYQLERDLDIVLIDALRPFDQAKVLPAGFLREPATALKRADLFLLTRSDNVDWNQLKAIQDSLLEYSPDNDGVFTAVTELKGCISVAGQEKKAIDFLAGKKVFAFSGIGSPTAFKKSIEITGARLVSYKVFADHYNYQQEDLLTLLDQYSASQADLILTTEKDAVKLFDFAEMIGDLPFYYLQIAMEINESAQLIEVIKNKLALRKARHKN